MYQQGDFTMYKTQAEADQRIKELCLSNGVMVEEEPYLALYNKDKDGFVIYPKVATLELLAMRTGIYAGKDAAVFTHDENGKLLSASTNIKRFIMDQVCSFSSDPTFHSEYAKADWHKEKPHIFLGKISLARSLRHTFPDYLHADPTVSAISYEEIRCELNFGKGPAVSSKPPVSVDKTIPQSDDVHSIVQGIFNKVTV